MGVMYPKKTEEDTVSLETVVTEVGGQHMDAESLTWFLFKNKECP